jgi:hypothetical protein
MYAEFVAFRIPIWIIAAGLAAALFGAVLIVWLCAGEKRR